MMAEAKTSRLKDRPLSPHLQIYKPLLTMMMSIVHRITGGALFFGMLLLVWVLIAAAAGPNAYASVQWFMETLLGRLILFGYTWALIHHMAKQAQIGQVKAHGLLRLPFAFSEGTLLETRILSPF